MKPKRRYSDIVKYTQLQKKRTTYMHLLSQKV